MAALKKIDGAGTSPSNEFQQTSQFSRAWKKFKHHRLGLGGGIVVTLLVLATVLAPVVLGQDPNFADFKQRNAAPSAEHWLGTDNLGRDVLARVIYGGRVSLAVGVGAVFVYLVIGTIMGITSGYFGGRVDFVLQRMTDVVQTFPSFLLIMTFVSIAKPSLYNVILAIGIFGWPGICRVMRAETLSLRERDFVLAARCIGAPDRRILVRHVLPNIFSPLIVAATYGISGAILTETGLSFL